MDEAEPTSGVKTGECSERLRQALARYDAALLRQVANRLLRLRTPKPAEELIERMVETAENAAAIDRRLRELDPPGRGLLSLIAQSGLHSWRLGGLLELLSPMDVPDGLATVFQLLNAGLLCPELAGAKGKLKSFEEWLGQASVTGYRVFVHPLIAARALGSELPLPALEPCSGIRQNSASITDRNSGEFRDREPNTVREADGLEFLLRLGALWQQVRQTPLRLTQQGSFFKRDQERLNGDPLLTGPAADELVRLPDLGHLLVALGLSTGLLCLEDSQVTAKDRPDWPPVPPDALRQLWAAFLQSQAWDSDAGWVGLHRDGAPYPSASLLALVLLGRLQESEWVRPADVARWLATHHCYWQEQPHADLVPWADRFLLGVAYSLRLVQAGQDVDGTWLLRLSPMGRSVLSLGPAPDLPAFGKALLVQPNLEIVAYRQGLTPAAIADLSRFCVWKALGAACTLQLTPETVYRGLETGLSTEQIVQTLQHHAVRELPESVLQSLRTWSGKRERIAVYPSATVLEFAGPEDVSEALSRGLPGVRISDNLLVVAGEGEIDYRHFRLTGTRDYTLPPEPCVTVEPDGVTLQADLVRADLLLDTELRRFAVAGAASNGRRAYRLTPGALQQARDSGLTLPALEECFRQRTGRPLTPAVRLLWSNGETPPLSLRRLLVLQAPSPTLADGLMQWPETRQWIQARLGQQSLVVEEKDVPALKAKLKELGLSLDIGPS